jgi:hypothetical protein
LTVKLNAANETLVHATKQAQLYHDLIAMPRRKRDKVIAGLRVEMGVKVAKAVRVKEVAPVTNDGLVKCLTVNKLTTAKAKEIYHLANSIGIRLHDGKLPNKTYTGVWYSGSGIGNCVVRENNIIVTASEFMQRMRNHVGK